MMKQKYELINDYKYSYDTYTVNGDKKIKAAFEFYFKKPGTIRLKVIDGRFKDTILLYDLKEVHVKLGFPILSLTSITFNPENKWVSDVRGHKIYEADWGWFINGHLKMIEHIESEKIEAQKPFLIYNLISKNIEKTDFVAKEIVWIDKEEKVLVKFTQFDKDGNIIHTANYNNIVINSNLSDDLFKKY